MGVEQYQGAVGRFINTTARSVLTHRLERLPIKSISVLYPEILQDTGKKHIIGLFGPHRTTYDSTALAAAVESVCPQRSLSFLSRPPSPHEGSGKERALAAAKLVANPLLYPVYTMRDTPPLMIDRKNTDSFRRLVHDHRKLAPSIVFLAPDGGSSADTHVLDRRFVKARGTLMLASAFLEGGVPWQNLAIVPIGLKYQDGKVEIVVGEDLTPSLVPLIGETETAWKDNRINAEVSEGIFHSINALLT